jgi:hypothetical protein
MTSSCQRTVLKPASLPSRTPRKSKPLKKGPARDIAVDIEVTRHVQAKHKRFEKLKKLIKAAEKKKHEPWP